jgi:tetratricopeptide (TPR) repeat protein
VGSLLYLTLIVVFALAAFRLLRSPTASDSFTGGIFLLLIITYVVQDIFVFDTATLLWLLFALYAGLLVYQDDSVATGLTPSKTSVGVGGILALLSLVLIVPVVVEPLRANLLLADGYQYHIADVGRAIQSFERGLALNTFADLEYGYQAYDMYTAHQVTVLSGSEKVAAYEYAHKVLDADFKKYPYSARVATYLGHVLDRAPQEVVVDTAALKDVLNRAIELSPKRSQAWYLLANIPLRAAEALPQNALAEKKPFYLEAGRILEEYVAVEPALPLSRYMLSNLYLAMNDAKTAGKWADSALPLYTASSVSVAAPAAKYYIAISDWQNAKKFLTDVIAEDPTDYDSAYNLAKVAYLGDDMSLALEIVQQLRVASPGLVETDQNFLRAITAYEQSKK